MIKILTVLIVGYAITVAVACSNSDNTAAKAGTADSSGIGHAKGKGTPYRGDSAVKGIQSDTITK